MWEHKAIPKGHSVLPAGDAATVEIDRVQKKLKSILAASQQRTGSQRNAAHNESGHQWTPAFLLAALRDVLEGRTDMGDLGTTSKPCGGFTDVGLHTGGAARDVCWPLVVAVLTVTATHRRMGLLGASTGSVVVLCAGLVAVAVARYFECCCTFLVTFSRSYSWCFLFSNPRTVICSTT